MTTDIITALQNEAAEVFPFLPPAHAAFPHAGPWKIGTQGPLTILRADLGPVTPGTPSTGHGSLVFSVGSNGAALGYLSSTHTKTSFDQPLLSCYGREAFDGNDPNNIVGCLAHLWTVWTTKVAPRSVYQILPKGQAKLSSNSKATRIALFMPQEQTAAHLTFGDRLEVALTATPHPVWFRILPPHPQASPVWQESPTLGLLLNNPDIFIADGQQLPLKPQEFARQLGSILNTKKDTPPCR